jgi:hypothetical protein
MQHSKLAMLIAVNEGFGTPGAIPTVRNNPGDLRHSPHSSHNVYDASGKRVGGDDIGVIDTVEHGWADLERQLGIYAAQGLTLLEMVNVYLGFAKDAPLDTSIVDGNNRVPYLRAICDGLGVPASTTVASAILLG